MRVTLDSLSTWTYKGKLEVITYMCDWAVRSRTAVSNDNAQNLFGLIPS